MSDFTPDLNIPEEEHHEDNHTPDEGDEYLADVGLHPDGPDN